MEFTIVNLLPFAVSELKPGLIPEQYYIPPQENGKPGILHVRDGKSNLYVRDGKTYPITHPAEEVAKAIVNDYAIAQLQADEYARPALFSLPGILSADEVLLKHKAQVEEARAKQNAWFMKLIRLADDDWERTKQHRMITDIQRHAARAMGQLTKPWMQNIEPEEYKRCPACSTLYNVQAAVCPNCKHVVNAEKAKAIGYVGA